MDGEAWTHAVVSAAVVIEMDNGACRKARLVLGGVAPIPWRVPARPNGCEAVIAGANPLPKNKYKVPLTREIAARGIMQASGEA